MKSCRYIILTFSAASALPERPGAVSLPTNIAYSGMMYATGVEGATVGTLYKVLPYYDKETGVLDVEAIGALDIERLRPYANGKNTFHIYVRLANGELLEAFNTILSAN